MPDDDAISDLERTMSALDSPTAAPHPEEMKGTVTFSIGKFASVTASGRATPAGLISAAMLACAVLIPVLRAVRRR